jgi:predicted nuclease of restriction endonuclease-like (RecB) superfamily
MTKLSRPAPGQNTPPTDQLLSDVRGLIVTTRARVASTFDAALLMLYWSLGRRVREDLLDERRAPYGEQIVATLSRQLSAEFGRGYSRQNLFRMVQFAAAFTEEPIVATLSRRLSWSHVVRILPLDDPLKRDFYAEMCRVEGWSVRVLADKIDSMLFERTALSRKPDELVQRELAALHDEDKLSPDLVFRDPYLLDFLGLRDTYSEKDLESAILREMEAFILELGVGFAFVERQKRITVDGDDYYLDLLFFHRRLRRLVAIELKLGSFKPAYKGQMELYLRWLDGNERREGEESPLGLILCAGKKEETVRLMDLEGAGIRVASYWTESLPKEQLEQKLHAAVVLARQRLSAVDETPGREG